MLFAFILEDRPGSEDLRQRLRAHHIEYMLTIKDRTVFGGPILTDDGTTVGSIFAADFPDRDAAASFIAAEPYTRGGLFRSVEIFRWRQMVPEPTEGFLLAELERQRTRQSAAESGRG